MSVQVESMSVAEVVKGIHDVTIVASNVAELRTFLLPHARVVHDGAACPH